VTVVSKFLQLTDQSDKMKQIGLASTTPIYLNHKHLTKDPTQEDT
jgi:hypothetical protein